MGLRWNPSCADVLTYGMPTELFLTPSEDAGSIAEKQESVRGLSLIQCLVTQGFAGKTLDVMQKML